MSKLYACTGTCNGKSDMPGACQTDGCPMKGQPLQEMNKCDHCGATYGLNEEHHCSM